MSELAYLIYVPILEYEDSLDPLMIAHTEADANRIVQELQDWCDKRAKLLGPVPDVDTDDAEWDRFRKREEQLRLARPPYRLKELRSAVLNYRDYLVIEVMALPVETPND